MLCLDSGSVSNILPVVCFKMNMKESMKVIYPEDLLDRERYPKSKPVIFLFGWAGASEEKMGKYSQIYSQAGYITVTYTAPWTYIFVSQEKIPGKSRELLFYLQEYSFKSNPMVFHVFSNLGCAVYQHFSSEILQNESFSHMRENFKGIVFDSCPGKRKIRSFFNAMAFVLSGNVFRRKILPFFYFIYLGVKILSKLCIGQKPPILWWDYLINDPIQVPQLYLISKADICVAADDSQEMAQIRKDSGVAVTCKVFENSEHVNHFDMYPQEYSQEVLNFLTQL